MKTMIMNRTARYLYLCQWSVLRIEREFHSKIELSHYGWDWEWHDSLAARRRPEWVLFRYRLPTAHWHYRTKRIVIKRMLLVPSKQSVYKMKDITTLGNQEIPIADMWNAQYYAFQYENNRWTNRGMDQWTNGPMDQRTNSPINKCSLS